jgi:hypothetical protein
MNESDVPLGLRVMVMGLLSLIGLAVWYAVVALFLVAPADAHGWYSDLKVPGSDGAPCCGDKDCAPYPHRTTAGEQAYEVFIFGKWWPVPPNTILQDAASPDGQVHVCCYYEYGEKNGCEAHEPPDFRCVIIPRSAV